MSIAWEWLKDEESFQARLAAAAERLVRLTERRHAFLQAALRDLTPLMARAESLGDLELLGELRIIRDAALAELGQDAAPAILDGNPVSHAVELEPAGVQEAPHEAEVLEAACEAVVSSIEHAVSRGPAPKDPGFGTTEGPQAGEAAPQPVRKTPKWTPRARQEAADDLATIRAALNAGLPVGGLGLATLKSLACKLRQAWAEQEERAESQEETRSLQRALCDLARQQFEGPYVIPLDVSFRPETPALWETLSGTYRSLIPALEAYEWFQAWQPELTEREMVTLLESIGAVQQRLYRLLVKHFAAKRDEQQVQLFDGIRSSRESLGIYLSALNPDTSDAELTRLANRMESEYRSSRAAAEKRRAQSLALGELQGILAAEEFGDREGDEQVLQQACLRCLQAGVPPTKPEFRNSLLDWGCFLESVKGLEKLSAEVEKERDRLERKQKPAATAEEIEEAALSPEIEKLRLELVPLTRGKTCLFVGGHPSEAHRHRIIDALELKDLLWPESDRFDARAADLDGDLRHSDLVALLVRFMRKGMKNVKGPCKAEGKPVIHLARGLNVSRVITSFHSQLVHAA